MATDDSSQFDGMEGLEELEEQMEGMQAAEEVSELTADDAVEAIDIDDDGIADVVTYDTDQDGDVDYAEADLDGDGTMDLGLQDADDDGEVDYAYGGEGWEPVSDDNMEADTSLEEPTEMEITVETEDGEVETYHVEVYEEDVDDDWDVGDDT